MSQKSQLPNKRKAGRPPATDGRDPKYLLRFLRMLHAYQQARDGGLKYESAIREAQGHLLLNYGLHVNKTEFKRILAHSHDSSEQFEFAVRSHVDTEGREGMALYVREKPAYPHPSKRGKRMIAT